MSALVAPSCNHAILSTGQMAQRGWWVSICSSGVVVSLSSGNHEVALGTTVFSNVGWCYSIPTKNYRRSFSSEISLPGDGSSRGGLGNGLRSGDRGPSHSAGLREPPDIGGARGSDRRDVVESDFAEVDFVIEPERVTIAGGEGSRGGGRRSSGHSAA